MVLLLTVRTSVASFASPWNQESFCYWLFELLWQVLHPLEIRSPFAIGCSNFCGKFCIPSEIRSPIAIVHYKRVFVMLQQIGVTQSMRNPLPLSLWMDVHWTRMLSLSWRCFITVQFHRIQVPFCAMPFMLTIYLYCQMPTFCNKDICQLFFTLYECLRCECFCTCTV
jgi:hypothetical protein